MRTVRPAWQRQRRYCALIRGVGDQAKHAIYFFKDAAMCERMVSQQLHTSHGCFPLDTVGVVQVTQDDISANRAIALQAVFSEGRRELLLVPEEQREVLTWAQHIKVRVGCRKAWC